ncbi:MULTISPECIES: aminoacyl-tRNA hydrolase [Microbacterium]|uniref:aminoacyl-tRNA hydrolase n=1 Tax=Microbacterium TaxID=33882 RepID=UPI0022F10B45|nr:aminoacyl-tRNA hydrolase [Streptomyces sp. MS2A]
MAQTWLVVGLGNPGPRYAATRHNVGQMVVDELAARRGESFRDHRVRGQGSGAQVVETWVRPGGDKIVLAKPTSFMNVSGTPVASLARFYSVPAERVVLVHDELDIPFDTIKLKVGGGHGGHNGIRDVARALATPDFPRVRVGIGRPPGRQDPADWVLAPFGAAERPNLPVLVSDAADAVEQLIEEGLVAAQQKHHAPRP